MNLPLTTSVLSILCIVTVGRHKWWGHLIGVANCVVFMVIAFHGQWGFIPSNIICGALYFQNAWRWRKYEHPEIRATGRAKVLEMDRGPFRRKLQVVPNWLRH